MAIKNINARVALKHDLEANWVLLIIAPMNVQIAIGQLLSCLMKLLKINALFVERVKLSSTSERESNTLKFTTLYPIRMVQNSIT